MLEIERFYQANDENSFCRPTGLSLSPGNGRTLTEMLERTPRELWWPELEL
jgi:hypothetical protein